MTAVELPVHLQITLGEYPQCEKRTQRTPDIVERCAKPSEWGVRCNHCGEIYLLCDEHAAWLQERQRPQGCSACKTVGLVPLRWTFYHLRCES